jgi:hypothetical protein
MESSDLDEKVLSLHRRGTPVFLESGLRLMLHPSQNPSRFRILPLPHAQHGTQRLLTVNQLKNVVFIPVKRSPMLGLKLLHFSQTNFLIPCFQLRQTFRFVNKRRSHAAAYYLTLLRLIEFNGTIIFREQTIKLKCKQIYILWRPNNYIHFSRTCLFYCVASETLDLFAVSGESQPVI